MKGWFTSSTGILSVVSSLLVLSGLADVPTLNKKETDFCVGLIFSMLNPIDI